MRDKDGVEDPDCRRVINALRAAAVTAKVGSGEGNIFSYAAKRYELTTRDVVFVGGQDKRLNHAGENSDGDPNTTAMGRTMPTNLIGGGGQILLGNFLGKGDLALVAAHEMLAHDRQTLLHDTGGSIRELNQTLWSQLPEGLKPTAELFRRLVF